MRKWIALLLAVVMCLAFAACGGAETVAEEPPQTEEPAAPEEVAVPEETESLPEEEPADDTVSEEPASAEPAEDAVCCVITVSINPEFELQLNKNGAVLALTCLNEDAQAALENTDVTGMPVDEAITVLLEDIYRYDSTVFPEEQPQVKVTVAMYEEFTPIYQAIDRMDAAVMSFADSHQLLLAYMRGKAPASEEIRTVVSESVDDNGNRVLVEVDENGVEWKTVCQGESTQIIELIRTDPDGTVTHCDMEAGITTVTKPDGTTSQMQGVIGKG